MLGKIALAVLFDLQIVKFAMFHLFFHKLSKSRVEDSREWKRMIIKFSPKSHFVPKQLCFKLQTAGEQLISVQQL